ncbi:MULTISPECIES: TetR/AcrR family transcriptional regulator [unclassified Sphingomonas]|uniref:TetR/AcrR family transcriptional regulator n=1 Tax=unclassified Sphingomonas TaxID=196159 RepID=UPI0006F70118|nr:MULTISPECIES: TetR/AcrR family transcriptional regulator [unclassified Sphingomonas]KQM27964.1 TetR family transcriptional regulator [Sphingomonas sp. Leaf9]KQM44304.1 TetR family transcriptional regulator [Sphingomonas sp. Leaf11]
MKVDQGPAARKTRTGRPLSFDRDAALERAMLTFWRHGYETTSITDLTDAMGISTPSLYGAFGDKRRLFLESMQRYAGDPAATAAAIDAAPTARAAAAELLAGAIVRYTGETTPPGCLLASATASGSAASAEVQRAVADIRRFVIDRLQSRIARDVAEGLLPAATEASALAGLVMAMLQGLSVLARDGLDRASLHAIAETALRAWPEPGGRGGDALATGV